MKIDGNTYFSHPVLRYDNDDFIGGGFDLEISIRESDKVEVNFVVSLVSPDIQTLIDDGRACVGAFFRCQDTFYSELRVSDKMSGTWHFKSGSLYGRVEVKPIIWLNRQVGNWLPEKLNPEFGENISIHKSEIIGLANDHVFSVGQDKLRKFETIFELVHSDNVSKGRVDVDLSSELIRILVPLDLYKTIEQMRGTKGGKLILLSSVYMPVLMEVLDNIRAQDGSGFDDRPWYRVFSAKCDHLGIDLDEMSLLESAQKLLGSPVEKLGPAFMDHVDNV